MPPPTDAPPTELTLRRIVNLVKSDCMTVPIDACTSKLCDVQTRTFNRVLPANLPLPWEQRAARRAVEWVHSNRYHGECTLCYYRAVAMEMTANKLFDSFVELMENKVHNTLHHSHVPYFLIFFFILFFIKNIYCTVGTYTHTHTHTLAMLTIYRTIGTHTVVHSLAMLTIHCTVGTCTAWSYQASHHQER